MDRTAEFFKFWSDARSSTVSPDDNNNVKSAVARTTSKKNTELQTLLATTDYEVGALLEHVETHWRRRKNVVHLMDAMKNVDESRRAESEDRQSVRALDEMTRKLKVLSSQAKTHNGCCSESDSLHFAMAFQYLAARVEDRMLQIRCEDQRKLRALTDVRKKLDLAFLQPKKSAAQQNTSTASTTKNNDESDDHHGDVSDDLAQESRILHARPIESRIRDQQRSELEDDVQEILRLNQLLEYHIQEQDQHIHTIAEDTVTALHNLGEAQKQLQCAKDSYSKWWTPKRRLAAFFIFLGLFVLWFHHLVR